MPAPILQFKRGNAGVAGTVPALRPGEPAITLNNFDFFVGIDTTVANNKFFGSHRYWGREDGSTSLRLKLVDKNGSNSISLKSPNTLAGNITYTLPGSVTDGYFLKTNSSGDLSWAEIDLTLGIDADTGGPSTVNTSQILSIDGTANEIETSVSGQTITVGLPNEVIVGTSLSAPTIRTGTIQSSNTGATAISVVASDVTVANDLTVQGNLYVQGSTTQIDTTTLTIEDRTIELGRIVNSQPATTSWDLAVLFNYGDGTAKKAGLVWEASGATKRFQFTTDVNPGNDGSDSQPNFPVLTVTNFAPIEVSELWINNTCTGGSSQVIGCSGSELVLQNISIDAGSY